MFADAFNLETASEAFGIPLTVTIVLCGIGYVVGFFWLSHHKKKVEKELVAFKSDLEAKDKYIDHHFHKLLETHKADLQRDYDVQLERLRADASQKNIKLTEFFTTQCEVIITAHQKLTELQTIAEKYSPSFDSGNKENMGALCREKIQEFRSFFILHTLYFPKPTRIKITDFLGAWNSYLFRFNTAAASARQHGSNSTKIDEIYEGVKAAEKEAASLLPLLEDDFQDILGIENKAKV